MDTELAKASTFVQRLLANPTLQGLSPLQKEDQILQFLKVNANQLFPTLSSPAFFPNMSWQKILNLLLQSLHIVIDEQLKKNLGIIINDDVDFKFISFLRQQNWPLEKIKEDLYNYVQEILNNKEIRKEFTGPYMAIAYHFVDKYIDQVFVRKEYVHFELTKVQRLKMSKEEIKDLVKVSLLLKPTIRAHSSGSGEIPAGIVQMHYAEKVFASLQESLPAIPDEVLKSALNSNVSFLENRFLEATSRITAILSAMCLNYRPKLKIDRGADTQEKSWLSIARRNFRYYGFDVKLIDEFYKIAAENGW